MSRSIGMLLVSASLLFGLEGLAGATTCQQAAPVDTCKAASPLDGKTLPANVRFIPTRTLNTGAEAWSSFELLHVGGAQPVLGTGVYGVDGGDNWLFASSNENLPAGEYRLVEQSSCSGAKETHFTISDEEVALPKSAGSLNARQTFVPAGRSTSGNCPQTFDVDVIEVQVDLDLASELEPFMPVLWLSSGLSDVRTRKGPGDVTPGRSTIADVFVSCGKPRDGLLQPGSYSAYATAEILELAPDGGWGRTNASLTVDVVCPGTVVPAESPTPTPTPAAEAPRTNGARGEGEPLTGDYVGCAMSHRSSGSVGGLALLACVLGLVARRRVRASC